MAEDDQPQSSKGGSLVLGRPAQGPQSGANRQAWMVTFADLVALLLTFFVMLFAMSRIETRDWQNLADALANTLNDVNEARIAVPSARLDLERVQPTPGANLDYLRSVLQNQMAGHPLLSRAQLGRSGDKLVISLPSDLLFAAGSAEPSSDAAVALYAICGFLRNLDNRIEIAGHADPSPLRDGRTTNWSLSLARAVSVAGLLQRSCYSGQIVALGYGDSRFEELPSSLPEARRRELARRVDIFVHESARLAE